jgi:hypothetical protein
MTLFYLSRDLTIDDQAYMPSGDHYLLHDLSDIHVYRGKPDPLRKTGTHFAAGALILAAATGPLLDTPTGWGVSTLAFFLVAGTGGFSLLNRRPRWELRAAHHGREICLLSTTDERTFGQVRRGLLRAVEATQRD